MTLRHSREKGVGVLDSPVIRNRPRKVAEIKKTIREQEY